jgi:hypothetical protein
MENSIASVPTSSITPPTNSSSSSSFLNKNMLIIALVILLILSFLGINLLNIFGDFVQTIINIFGPLFSQILSVFGYTTGSIINKSADIVSDTAKLGIDVAEGSIQSIGNLLKDAGERNVDPNARYQLDRTLNDSKYRLAKSEPDNSTSPIQKPITSNKVGWCLVGEYEGKRGCIEVSDQDQCLSGQIFPDKQMCLNPTLTSNMTHPLKSESTRL